MGVLKDVRDVARGWRWGHPPLVPRSVGPLEARSSDVTTEWARRPAARAVRGGLQRFVLAPLLAFEVDGRVEGLDVFAELEPPVIFVANHSSHLDAPLVLTALPPSWRRRTAVGAAADYFFGSRWRAAATALVFNAFPVERRGMRRSTGSAGSLLGEGWNLLVFPEGTRSEDGWMGNFRPGSAWLALQVAKPVVPVAISGSWQAMPRGRSWPVPGRPPVAVRFGRPLFPEPGERIRPFNHRIREALAMTLDEENTSWWEAERRAASGEVPDPSGPRGARWRRMWEASRGPRPSRSSRSRVWPES